jgi:methyltransferase-like protein
MAEINKPIYFQEFIERAEKHGLVYVGNGELKRPFQIPGDLLQMAVGRALDPADLEERLILEQYLDFLRNQTFRQTLLCHKETTIDREFDPDGLKDFRMTSRLAPPEDGLEINSTEEVEFTGPEQVRVATSHPLSKALLSHLGSVYPQSLPYEVALERAVQILEEAGATDLDVEKEQGLLDENLIMLYRDNVDLIRFHTYQPVIALELSEKPVASAVAREQVQKGIPIGNMYHQSVTMDDFPKRLLAQLDGNKDRKTLRQLVVEAIDEGDLAIKKEDQVAKSSEINEKELNTILESILAQLAKAALLVG